MGVQRIHLTAADFKWLPNALTFTRLALVLPVFFAAYAREWRIGVVLVAAALATDFLDGLAAKKLHAESAIGGYVDSIVDFLLAAAGAAALVNAGLLPAWTIAAAVPPCLFIFYAKFIAPKGSRVQTAFPLISLPLLFGTWTAMAWGYLRMAYGWSWLYIPVTAVLFVGLCLLKRHRIRAWYGWLAAAHRDSKL